MEKNYKAKTSGQLREPGKEPTKSIYISVATDATEINMPNGNMVWEKPGIGGNMQEPEARRGELKRRVSLIDLIDKRRRNDFFKFYFCRS